MSEIENEKSIIEIHEEEAHDFDPDKDSFDLDDISLDSDEEDDCGNKCVEILSELLASQYKINEKYNSETLTNLESSIIICEHHKNLFESINKNYNRHSQSNIISSILTLLPNHKESKELLCDQFFEESSITSLDQQIILYDYNIPITNNKCIGDDKRNSIREEEDKIINQEYCEYQQSLYDNNMTSQQSLSSMQLCNNFSNINNINICNKSFTSNNGSITSVDQVKVRNKEGPQVPPKPKIDSVRLSMAAVKDSSDWELDALLNELNHLEDQLNSSTGTDQLILGIPTLLPPSKIKKDNNISIINQVPKDISTKIYRGTEFSRQNVNCFSPDIDSAFGDTSTDCGSNFTRTTASDFSSNDSCRGSLNTPSPTQQETMTKAGVVTPPASVVSSCSSSSGVSSTSSNIKQCLYQNSLSSQASSPIKENSTLTPAQIKAEKIREALEKMKEANIKKVYVKFFLEDNHTISLLIDERWSCVEVMKVIVSKLGISLHPEHCIVEEYPQLRIKRIYEDHESVVENILMWTQDSQNKLYFKRQQDKYAFILKPQIFLINERTKEYLPSPQINLTAAEREKVLKLFFQPDSTLPPEIDGYLFLKQDGKKSWKRHYFVLRSSGLYYSIKGKSKSPKDLQCIMNFHSNQIYTCTDWKKKYKAPTGYGFSIKPPQIQVKNSKYIKYICAETDISYMQWICALRIAKNGYELYKAYNDGMRRMVTSQCHTPIKVETPSISSRINSPMPHISHGNHIFEMGNQNSNDNSRSISTPSSKTSNSEQVSMASMCFDQDDCGTIKRSPVEVTTPLLNIKNNQQGSINCNVNLRGEIITEDIYRNSCISDNSSRQLFVDDRSGVVTPSIEVPSEDFDSDEEPLPPPPMSATFVSGSEQQGQYQSFTPTSYTNNGTPIKSALKKTPPPPPPKRSNTTRLQMTHDVHQNVSSFHNELQNAMNRRLNILERS
ncbi:Pico [Strongyloides ratti]|uniref:Pico n=1 Tax=Strongyloides ratti TaxID=34506 RepID=A0A090LCN4_STRRB|nr:Pico [Strongyloides ratti]CEF65245.1 Pico [Strongyloides ratti]